MATLSYTIAVGAGTIRWLKAVFDVSLPLLAMFSEATFRSLDDFLVEVVALVGDLETMWIP